MIHERKFAINSTTSQNEFVEMVDDYKSSAKRYIQDNNLNIDDYMVKATHEKNSVKFELENKFTEGESE